MVIKSYGSRGRRFSFNHRVTWQPDGQWNLSRWPFGVGVGSSRWVQRGYSCRILMGGNIHVLGLFLQWSILIWWAFFLAVSLVNTSFKIHWILQATSVGRRLIRGGLQAGSPTSLGFQRVLCSPVFRALLPCYIPPSRNQPRRAWDWASWCCWTSCRQTCDSIASSLLLLMVFDSSARWPLRSTVHRSISRRTMLWCCRCTWGCNLYGLHSSRTLFWSPPSLVSMWIYI